MLVWATDEAGGTLTGALDGVNKTFRTLQPMRLDRIVDVYVNGQRRVGDLGNGYTLQDAHTVVLSEAPVPEDTVAVAYCTDQVFPAVANGTPRGLSANALVPLPLEGRLVGQPQPLRAIFSCREDGP